MTAAPPGVVRSRRPVALVTGVGRRAGIGAAIAARLAADGWDVAITLWAPYDDRMPWGHPPGDQALIEESLRAAGAATCVLPADLSDPAAPARILEAAQDALGPVRGLVLCHTESVDSGLLDTTVESFDRHFAVNARASWLLLREFALRYQGPAADTGQDAEGRIVALTSDHTAGNLPYGASKGALDRIVLAAARELAGRGITANVINPGPVDTGWLTPELHASLVAASPLGRISRPQDTASLVAFLCSADGGWINGQLLYSDGGLHA
jgi:3-oxoacyl-[acyl-carrier protein] reductase